MIDPVAELERLLVEGVGTGALPSTEELAQFLTDEFDESSWQRELAEFQREMEAEIRIASRSSSCACHR